MSKAKIAAELVEHYKGQKHDFQLFLQAVEDYFRIYPPLNSGKCPVVHSVKSRLKDENHLKKKILRKWDDGGPRTKSQLFKKITDLAGVRILHLHQDQFADIHEAIQKKLDAKEWTLGEKPVANSWDPEAGVFFKKLGLRVSIRDTYYTSVHYLIKPPTKTDIVCEVQVRTLFEEVWGEIDHTINYPQVTKSLECREQLRVLAKLVSTGSRLGDAIFRSHGNFTAAEEKKAKAKAKKK